MDADADFDYQISKKEAEDAMAIAVEMEWMSQEEADGFRAELDLADMTYGDGDGKVSDQEMFDFMAVEWDDSWTEILPEEDYMEWSFDEETGDWYFYDVESESWIMEVIDEAELEWSQDEETGAWYFFDVNTE